MRKILIIICVSLLGGSNLYAQQSGICTAPGFHQDIKVHFDIQDPNEENILALSGAYQALGDGLKALEYAENAINTNPLSGSALIAKVHALHLLGREEEALNLALTTYDDKDAGYQYSRGENSWLRHSILAMLMEAGKFEEAQKLILSEFPEMLMMMAKQVEPLSLDLGAPLHTYEAYIHILNATGREDAAMLFEKHLKGFSAESFFEANDEELAATQNWMLASIWAGTLDEKVVPALTMAYEKGFTLGWRFNYLHHPVYWPYQDNADFIALMKRINSDMTAQLRCLN